MKRFLKIVAVLFALCAPTVGLCGSFGIFQTALPSNPNLRQENFFGLTGSAWQNTGAYYVPGTGNPAVSTADYYHSDGLYWFRPYYLRDPACGSAGTTIANARGDYVWFASQDHASGTPWQSAGGMRMGFSNDPGVPPDRMEVVYSSDYQSTPFAKMADITASISSNNLIVTAITGVMSFDNNSTVQGAGVTDASVMSQTSGTPGGIGTYVINGAPQTVGSQAMTVSIPNYFVSQTPYLVCNPDDPTHTFYVYSEGSSQRVGLDTGLITSNDLVTWTAAVPSHINYTFNSQSAYHRPTRTGVNTWYSTGLQVNFPQTSGATGSAKWTSTDGKIWAPNPTTLFNACIPANTTGPVGATPCPDTPAQQMGFGASLSRFTVGAQDWTAVRSSTVVSGVRTGGQTVARVPIDANYNVLASPTKVNVSAAYGGGFPGPGYLQDMSSYIEDGIAHYYAQLGFPPSFTNVGTVTGATYSNGGACVLNVANTCGGLWQQAVDYYTEIIDASAAAGAAPIGVKDSCASSVASLTWFNALSQQTYRLYRGTSAGSQPTLVGDFTGTTATDSGTTLNALTYHKLVYLHNGIEQKSRVTSTWCSTSSASVNAHMTRASVGGADMTTCDRTVLDAVDSWLVSNSLSNNILFGTMAQFCVAKSGSVITKIFDIGTTRLPRGGDYTPTTTSTTYSTTGINGRPSWVNGTNVAWGYYGGSRSYLNNIRRKTQITVFSAYQKSHAFQVTPISIGQGTGLVLWHSTGSPGGANFLLSDATHSLTATATISGLATDFHTLTGTYDPTNGLIVYADGVAGSPAGGTPLVIPSPNLLPPDALTGYIGVGTLVPFLAAGTTISKYNFGTAAYEFADNQAQLNGEANFIFDKAMTAGQAASFNTMIRSFVGL